MHRRPDLDGRGGGSFGVTADNDDGRTLSGKRERGGAAHAVRTAGDEKGLVLDT